MNLDKGCVGVLCTTFNFGNFSVNLNSPNKKMKRQEKLIISPYSFSCVSFHTPSIPAQTYANIYSDFIQNCSNSEITHMSNNW